MPVHTPPLYTCVERYRRLSSAKSWSYLTLQLTNFSLDPSAWSTLMLCQVFKMMTAVLWTTSLGIAVLTATSIFRECKLANIPAAPARATGGGDKAAGPGGARRAGAASSAVLGLCTVEPLQLPCLSTIKCFFSAYPSEIWDQH